MNPILVEVVRNDRVESVHRGSVFVADPTGTPVLRAGTPEELVFPRSSNKPMQALAMLRCGVELHDIDLALATGSHSGEPAHVERVRGLLAAGGFAEEDLQCPPQLPIDEVAAHAVLAGGGGRSRVLMNCSGKHAAMLLTCRAAGWPTADYLAPAHPLQQQVRRVVEELADEPVTETGVDGCGAPLFAISLVGLARCFARLVTGDPGTPQRRVADAMRAHPLYVAGSSREDTLLMQAVPGLMMKGGAEGVHAAALADGSAVTLKIDDGGTRARMPVMVAALRHLGVEAPELDRQATSVVLGGESSVGEVRMRPGALAES
ncbi:MAG: asparaginase [Geodermatophilaceae bacterium]|nr:asparaginase [Geodermatophilaceae bacterium]MDQ3464653.1 asparaginase [Actinomycetota bacterium]